MQTGATDCPAVQLLPLAGIYVGIHVVVGCSTTPASHAYILAAVNAKAHRSRGIVN